MINTSPVVKPQFYDIFYGKKERIYLDGEWQMKQIPCSHSDYLKTMNDNLSKLFVADNTWTSIIVPNYTDAKTTSLTVLKREFNYAKKGDRRPILTFEGLAWEPHVFINGQKAAVYDNLAPGWNTEYFTTDITAFVKEGKNEIAVVYFNNLRQKRLLASGIYAPVFIDIVEPVYASEMLITPQLPDKISVKCLIENTTGKTVDTNLSAEVNPWKEAGTKTTSSLGKTTLKPGTNQFDFTVKINSPVLWDVDNPFLYSLTLKNNDKTVGMERFGLREFVIKGNEFYLNGRPFYCYGPAAEEGNISRLMYVETFNPQFMNNGNDLLRKYLENMKKANVNSIMRYPVITRAVNALSDEIGILNFHMIAIWRYYDILPDNVKKQILAPGKNPASYSQGFFYEKDDKSTTKICSPDVFNLEGRNLHMANVFAKLGAQIRNNPSVAAILSGNENFRECNQGFDLPVQRAGLYRTAPGVLFAGTHGISRESIDLTGQRVPLVPRQDFVNFAGLACGGGSCDISHFSLYPYTLKKCAEEWVYNGYPQKLPIYADESLFYGTLRTMLRKDLWDLTLKTYSPMLKNGRLDRDGMLKVLCNPDIVKLYNEQNYRTREKMRAELTKNGWWPFRMTLKLVGLQTNFLDKNEIIKAIAERTKRSVEMVRIYDQYMQGVGATTGPVLEYDVEKLVALEQGAIKGLSPIGEAFKQTYAPVFACLDMYEKYSSIVAGETMKLKVFAFNNSSAKLGNPEADITLRDPSGKIIHSQKAVLKLAGVQKAGTAIEIPIDANLATGEYSIELVMSDSNKKLSSNFYKLFVLGKSDAQVKRSSQNRIYVLEGNNAGSNKLFRDFLTERGLEVTYTQTIPELKENDSLIIAPLALNKENASSLGKLADWVKGGGKILVLEQDYYAPMPLLPGYRLIRLSGKSDFIIQIGIDLMIVNKENPAFDKISKRSNWYTLNNQYGEIYNSLIGPLDTNAEAIGADTGAGEGTRAFGALLLNVPLGKGKIIWSQVEAVKAASMKDGVATRYLVNLISQL
ncbi:MAG: hypothetical protein A2017_13455 [Lentisphaerae bacterium GWF2_44_16]|nr:MAG: hypothetical protein A2017_13455 [Lentisphaerae bacterium GWF2_44_16]